ncbi:MAG: hypothetical protein KatS3mg083_609 [Candidatus Dojkabacteria bacterium]|nr:MAG: hypothetical protein KatS3mg083_609 [Candidatus Dojkabacteria bacterium]
MRAAFGVLAFILLVIFLLLCWISVNVRRYNLQNSQTEIREERYEKAITSRDMEEVGQKVKVEEKKEKARFVIGGVEVDEYTYRSVEVTAQLLKKTSERDKMVILAHCFMDDVNRYLGDYDSRAAIRSLVSDLNDEKVDANILPEILRNLKLLKDIVEKKRAEKRLIDESEVYLIEGIEVSNKVYRRIELAAAASGHDNERGRIISLIHYYESKIQKALGIYNDKVARKRFAEDINDESLSREEATRRLREAYRRYLEVKEKTEKFNQQDSNTDEQENSASIQKAILLFDFSSFVEVSSMNIRQYQKFMLLAVPFIFILFILASYVDYVRNKYTRGLKKDLKDKVLQAEILTKIFELEPSERNLKIVVSKIYEIEASELNGEHIDKGNIVSDIVKLCNEKITDYEASGMVFSAWINCLKKKYEQLTYNDRYPTNMALKRHLVKAKNYINKYWYIFGVVTTIVVMIALVIYAIEFKYTWKGWVMVVVPTLLLGALNVLSCIRQYLRTEMADNLMRHYFYRLKVAEVLNRYWGICDASTDTLLLAYQYKREVLEMEGVLDEQTLRKTLEELDRNIRSNIKTDDAEGLALFWCHTYEYYVGEYMRGAI